MLEHEAFQLLTLASARDGRNVSQAVARVWADDLAGVPVDEAIAAAREHYRESTAWLMPAHVLQGVKRLRGRAAREAVVEAWFADALEDDPGLDRAAWWSKLARLSDVAAATREYAARRAAALEVEA